MKNNVYMYQLLILFVLFFAFIPQFRVSIQTFCIRPWAKFYVGVGLWDHWLSGDDWHWAIEVMVTSFALQNSICSCDDVLPKF